MSSSSTSLVAYRLVSQFLHGRMSRVTHYVSVVMTTGLWLTPRVTFYGRHLLLLLVISWPTNHRPAPPSDMNNSWLTPDWLGWPTVVRLVSCSGAAVLVASHAWLFRRQGSQAWPCWPLNVPVWPHAVTFRSFLISTSTVADLVQSVSRPRLWNNLPLRLRHPELTHSEFRRWLRTHLFCWGQRRLVTVV